MNCNINSVCCLTDCIVMMWLQEKCWQQKPVSGTSESTTRSTQVCSKMMHDWITNKSNKLPIHSSSYFLILLVCSGYLSQSFLKIICSYSKFCNLVDWNKVQAWAGWYLDLKICDFAWFSYCIINSNPHLPHISKLPCIFWYQGSGSKVCCSRSLFCCVSKISHFPCKAHVEIVE